MFKLTIRTPNEDIFSGEINSVTYTAEDGDMQVFENHASLTATIAFSPIVVEVEDREENFLGRNGLFLFDNETNSALMLLNYCERKSEVTYQSAKEYVDFITKQLEEGKDLSEFQMTYLNNEKIAVEQQMEELEP